MKGITGKVKIYGISLLVFIFSVSGIVLAESSSDINIISDKTTTDIYKVWNVKFKAPVDLNSLTNNVRVRDLGTGVDMSVSANIGDDDSSIKINSPTGGYKVGHEYQIVVDKGVKSKKGTNLKKIAVMNFKVISGGSSSGGNSNIKYTASANVLAAPALPILKQITINSATLSNVKKYKIEENNKIFNIGTSMISAIGENTTTVYFYDNNENILGKGILDVSKSANNIIIQVTPQN